MAFSLEKAFLLTIKLIQLTLMKIYLITLTFLLSSCAILESNKSSRLEEKIYTDIEYTEHLNYLANTYLSLHRSNQITLDRSNKLYFKNLIKRIKNRNSKLFASIEDIQIHIIKSKQPFFFSLPKNHIFLSTRLLNKYVYHEAFLISLLTQELIKLEKSLYPKTITPPTGVVSLSKLISLTHTPIEIKNNINIASYYVLQKLNIDPYVFLLWIQIRSKNSHQFTLHNGNADLITLEELKFKSFLISKGFKEITSEYYERNSSKEFYKFIRKLRTHYEKKAR